jgi:hypothetical protein
VAVLLGAAVLGAGCSGDAEPLPPVADPTATVDPAYDATLDPSLAVLSLVPSDARTLTVTDRVEAQDAAGEADALVTLAPELLRSGALADYGLGSDAVSWEARFSGAAGEGWVVALRDGTDMAQVQAAVTAGVGPLAGAQVDNDRRLVTLGATDDPQQSWAADAELRDLVGEPAVTTYVDRSCSPDATLPGASGQRLEELGPWSIQFGAVLATARLGADRTDLFTRLRASAEDPTLTAALAGGVADPQTGRLGYRVADPAAAAELVTEGALAFTACA